MRLVILGIDGTLTATEAVDAACFVAALERCFGISASALDWARYPHTTDSGILRSLFMAHLGRPPQPEEVACMQRVFLAELENAHAAAPEAFAPVAGVAEFIARLAQRRDWVPVLATGGWRRAARFKLRAAGLTLNYPLASADDGLAREAIIQIARANAHGWYGVERFRQVVSLGDAVWDVNAARVLKLPFVGRAQGAAAERLHNAGAATVISDFSDVDAVFEALDAAKVPTLRPHLAAG